MYKRQHKSSVDFAPILSPVTHGRRQRDAGHFLCFPYMPQAPAGQAIGKPAFSLCFWISAKGRTVFGQMVAFRSYRLDGASAHSLLHIQKRTPRPQAKNAAFSLQMAAKTRGKPCTPGKRCGIIFRILVEKSAKVRRWNIPAATKTGRGRAVSYTHLDVYKRQTMHWITVVSRASRTCSRSCSE